MNYKIIIILLKYHVQYILENLVIFVIFEADFLAVLGFHLFKNVKVRNFRFYGDRHSSF